MHTSRRLFSVFAIALFFCLWLSCRKPGNAKSAFYYWKSSFSLDTQQTTILKNTANNTLYIRFFDIDWDSNTHRALPDAIISFKQSAANLNITPVIYITNKTFENITDAAIDSLATNSNMLVNHIAQSNQIKYQNMQLDCDWTVSTRTKYFNFITAFKKINPRPLAVTIRLHQVKYKERTGVPPADKGVLMFYNMGKIDAGLQQASSIYNEVDAEKYIAYIAQYPLPLDVALPLFSWSIQIRGGKVVQVYGNIGKEQLINTLNFDQTGNIYQSKKSFFLNGVYIKENDTFKLEETDLSTLKKAAKQLSAWLPPQKNRTIIYYELGNINRSEFKAEALNKVSADF